MCDLFAIAKFLFYFLQFLFYLCMMLSVIYVILHNCLFTSLMVMRDITFGVSLSVCLSVCSVKVGKWIYIVLTQSSQAWIT